MIQDVIGKFYFLKKFRCVKSSQKRTKIKSVIFKLCKIWEPLQQRVMNDLKRARLPRGRLIWLLAHPLPPLPSVSSTGDTQED
jgi:hypothetical protein